MLNSSTQSICMQINLMELCANCRVNRMKGEGEKSKFSKVWEQDGNKQTRSLYSPTRRDRELLWLRLSMFDRDELSALMAVVGLRAPVRMGEAEPDA